MKVTYDATSNNFKVELELTQEQAQQIIDHYFRIYSDFRLNTPLSEATDEYKSELRKMLEETKRGQYVLVRGEQQALRQVHSGNAVVFSGDDEPTDEKDIPDRS